MEKYVIDTNLLFNMEGNMGLGEKTEEIVKALTKVFQKIAANVKIYMPQSIKAEIESFFDDPGQTFLQDFFSSVTIKSPNLSEIMVSSSVMAQFIDECRTRAYRGMNVAEESITKAAEGFMGKETLPRKEFQIAVGSIVKSFRERYRNATRTNFIDSSGDFDLIMLAREQDAYLVSTDEGVIRWGRQFGVKEMTSVVFGKKMQEHL